jgi:hypothetical protein
LERRFSSCRKAEGNVTIKISAGLGLKGEGGVKKRERRRYRVLGVVGALVRVEEPKGL